MDNNEKNTLGTESSWDSFLKTGWSWEWSNIYGDFFQETSDGTISIGPKAQKSWLEVATGILGYIVPIVVFLTIIWSAHVFLRTQEKSGFAENYQIICPYLNYGVDAKDKWCKTIEMITDEYTKKSKELQNEIIKYLTEYIPIKVSQNIMDASPERKFIIDTYDKKILVDQIMEKFEEEKKKAQYVGWDNIECSWITITGKSLVTTQCTIYWWNIWDDDSNRKLGSARIEALRFLDKIGTTSSSQFILLNPPIVLGTEKIPGWNNLSNVFQSRTTVQLQLQYVPLTKKL